MREILWVAAILVVALLLTRTFRSRSIPDPPQDQWFQTHVTAPSADRPVVVKFGATWCGPCRAMESQLDDLVSELPGRVLVVRVDIDESPELARHFHVGGIPDTMVFHQGHGVARQTGLLTTREMKEWLAPWLQ